MKELWAKGPTTNWELIDTADDVNDIETLMAEYSMAFGPGWLWEVR